MSARAWDDTSWIKVGARVRYLGDPTGHWHKSDQSDRVDLRTGDIGTVDGWTDGYPRHRCPDHREAPDCVCGDDAETTDERGWIDASPKCARVQYQGGFRAVLYAEDEGTRWERV